MQEINLNDNTIYCGIYQIVCIGNNASYIGSSSNCCERIKQHIKLLRRDRYGKNSYNSHGKKLFFQHSYNKYSESRFKFYILKTCNETDLLLQEQLFIDKIVPKFNISLIAGRPPKHNELTKELQKQKYINFLNTKAKNNTFKHTQETIQQIVQSRKGYKHTKETVQKMILTKIQNNTLCVPHYKARGIKKPQHSEIMRHIMTARNKNMTNVERQQCYGSPGKSNGNCKIKLKFKNTTTGETNELYGFEWCRQYGVAAPQLSRVRHNRQNFITDCKKNKWMHIKSIDAV